MDNNDNKDIKDVKNPGKEYRGKKIEWGQIKYNNPDNSKITTEVARMIVSGGRSRELTQKEHYRLNNRLRDKYGRKKESFSFYFLCAVMGLVFVLLPHFIPNISQTIAIILNVIVLLFVFAFIVDEAFHSRVHKRKRKALENKKYELYELEVSEKLWSKKEDNEEQIHEFYIQCGDLILYVPKRVYKMVKDEIAVVLFSFGRKYVIEIFAPDE